MVAWLISTSPETIDLNQDIDFSSPKVNLSSPDIEVFYPVYALIYIATAVVALIVFGYLKISRRVKVLNREIAHLKQTNNLVIQSTIRHLINSTPSSRTLDFNGIESFLKATQKEIKKSRLFRLKGFNWFLTLQAKENSKYLAVYLHHDNTDFFNGFRKWSVRVELTMKVLEPSAPKCASLGFTKAHVFGSVDDGVFCGSPTFIPISRLIEGDLLLKDSLQIELCFKKLVFDEENFEI